MQGRFECFQADDWPPSNRIGHSRLFPNFFEWLFGSDSPPIPRQLLHRRHPLYPAILGISDGIVVTEGSAAPDPDPDSKAPLQKTPVASPSATPSPTATSTPTSTPTCTPTPGAIPTLPTLTNCQKTLRCEGAREVSACEPCNLLVEAPEFLYFCHAGCTVIGAKICEKVFPCP